MNLVATVLTALGTVFAAFAAWKASESTEHIAALQAVAQFNAIINSNSRAGACIKMLEASHNQRAEERMLEKKPFDIEVIDKQTTARCLQEKVDSLTGDKTIVSGEQSDIIFQQIFNYLNGYEAILLYWLEGKGNKQLICAQVFPGFSEHVRLIVGELKNLPNNVTAQRILDGVPAVTKFMDIRSCQ